MARNYTIAGTAKAAAACGSVHLRRLLCLLCAFLLPAHIVLYAQNQDVFQHPLSAGTIPRYTALCAELAAHPYITGTFEQTKTIARLNRSLTSKGNFIIAAELGMVWDTVSPFPSTMAVGRDFIVQSLPDGSKTKLEAGGSETFVNMAGTLSAVFTGNAAKQSHHFDNYFFENGKVWTIGLVPKDKAIRAFAERIVLSGAVGEAGAFVNSIVINEQNGNSVIYRLSGHRFPAGLNDYEKSLFSVN
ncbi:MAG: outer membrane lipoprotein carrier protein LolA [Treponema sp.]|nr:outer membrane lipoprotein carrier protein LolA [Treponema sp.]